MMKTLELILTVVEKMWIVLSNYVGLQLVSLIFVAIIRLLVGVLLRKDSASSMMMMLMKALRKKGQELQKARQRRKKTKIQAWET
eukprot:CAMPEP_0206183256 /NCGR_PEP_ID=MMETSP0166-20121206/530_1 /ASSEMBLY_ACC=CAM_ASM_000260 /TAXON_ID=95228 /ORGANISM="Vannella robusta, Strain DIVA3 518/3/11/1/6" /LENGTH=84 /DNA_ID=CAMNT_0053598077 /DNA_START=143 /DNA_END=397 /DNA_ORIENTATION=+